MAAQSSKKLATRNSEILQTTHLVSIAINAVSLLAVLILKRPSSSKPYILLSIPALILQYVLEKNGRPVYSIDAYSNNKKLVKSGDDISRSGLYEYMFDVLYITWAIDILMTVFGTNKVWWLFSIIPGFAVYTVAQFALPYFKKSKEPPSEDATPSESKRQSKLRARREKGQPVKYR
ncbi:uncharacterized protein PRCAT00004002001 [Priceomyces carsonii]|uniref:uncharacterized protein n=1 Tax=Priceomyces carsonii TaxID=28549 RepID=UPI002EDA7193|nr:unnamed protein product [Priceomyces carsonii]